VTQDGSWNSLKRTFLRALSDSAERSLITQPPAYRLQLVWAMDMWCMFVCFGLFVVTKLESLYFVSRLGLEINPWEYIHSGSVALPAVLPKIHHRQETLYVPSEVNTRQVDGLTRIPCTSPRMEKSHSGCLRTAWYVVNMFHRNGMRALIIANGTICYSILYCNSPTF